ncbi:MAG: LLM class flavin-dependent oxidoreductase [Beijerinckiaceae bacterium]|nr:LLM class flavin-dependent oxidoreductase [Beijerinckiaceae bacterium]MDO9442958.1 LLM class flavin-dependent oxidoreductase [Beijerinckiaceae bacterium]
MQFGLYAPLPHVTVGSPEIDRSVEGALAPLASGTSDPAYDLARDVLLAADEAGFDIALFAERHLGADLEAWVLASAISAQTKRMKAMVAVHPGLWHPVMVAKMAASLDRIAKGRMVINLVTGWNVEEARMFGGDIELGNEDRYARAEEFVDILRGVWTQTPFTRKGRIFDIDATELRLRPASATPPEIFTASRSPRGLDMVARSGDWWFLDYDKEASSVDEVKESLRRSISVMNEKASRLGRKVRYALNPFVAFGSSREKAAENAMKLLTTGPDADQRKIQSRIGPAMKAGCVGTPEQVREQLHAYEAMGIEFVLLKFVPTVEGVAEIRDELIQPLRG